MDIEVVSIAKGRHVAPAVAEDKIDVSFERRVGWHIYPGNIKRSGA